jgi:uncharacterized protein (UPF0332 family)
MTVVEIQHYMALASEELLAPQDNLQLGHLRACVSSSYYAMFYATTAVLGSLGLWRSKHQGVLSAFGESFVKAGLIEPQYGRMLHNAFEARLDSDYGPHPDLDGESAQELVDDATQFVARLAQFLESSTSREDPS